MGDLSIGGATIDFSQFRCKSCSKLIGKDFHDGHIEIKCLRCGTLNVLLNKETQLFVVTDVNGRIIFINDAMEKVSGFSLDESVNKKPSELWGKQMPQEFYDRLWRTIRDEKRTFTSSITNKNKAGKLYEVEMVISPVLGSEGNPIFYIGVERSK